MSDSPESTSTTGPALQTVVKARHDLRNPLGHVLGFGELLLDRAKRQGLDRASESLQELVQASEQILDEINHCLDLRRIKSGQADVHGLQQNVQRFCRRVVLLSQQARSEMGDQVCADVGRIVDSAERMQVLGNELLPPLQAGPSPAQRGSGDEAQPAGGEVIGLSAGASPERDRLVQAVQEAGYEVKLVPPNALAQMPIDVLIVELDLGCSESIQFLEGLKEQTATTRLPILVLARAPTAEAVRNALRAGAADVLRWPLQDELLLARMGCIVALKRLHEQERALLRRIAFEQQRCDQLLGALLPSTIVHRWRRGERCIAEHYPEAAVVSADFGGLSRWAAAYSPEAVVTGLTEVFAAYDGLCRCRSLPVGRVIGDSYQVVAGVPEPVGDSLELGVELALALQREALPLRLAGGRLLRARVGLHSGPVSAGMLGAERLSFEIWGETVEVARLLRAQAPPGAILTSSVTAACLGGRYVLESAPSVRLTESSILETRLLLGKVP